MRTIIVLVSFFNFFWFFYQSKLNEPLGCYICPWYHDWSWTNPPALILLAAVGLLFNRWEGHLWSMLVSGYLVGGRIYEALQLSDPVKEYSVFLQIITSHESGFVLQILEIQYFLALVVFLFSMSLLLIGVFYYRKTEAV